MCVGEAGPHEAGVCVCGGGGASGDGEGRVGPVLSDQYRAVWVGHEDGGDARWTSCGRWGEGGPKPGEGA